ncbi:MAG: glutamine--fructose-6-phosphate transaminase (isomerizing) [Acholeplasmataceae bacterium]
MCGIVGYVGKKNARHIVLEGLEKLEYRGYDSAGMSLFNLFESRFDVFKETGRVHLLKDTIKESFLSSCGIGHTRWATHGKVTKENAHPHVSSSGRFIIVHNGVIENSDALYQQYLPDYDLKSETDTEIIAHLIEIFTNQLTVDNAIVTTLKLLHGSFAILVLDNERPDVIYAAKQKSPLLVGVSDEGTTIASDVLALAGYSDYYVPLVDETFVVCSETEARFFNFELESIRVDYLPVEKDMLTHDLGPHDHYMMKEIEEQPRVIRQIMSNYLNGEDVTIDETIKKDIKESDRIYMIAAGTSMHAGMLGKRMFETLAGIPVEVHIASEFAYNIPLLSSKPYFILISQSGETADLRAALKAVEQLNRPVLTITNVKTSTLAREATYFLDVFAGPEIAVASTKAYVAQASVLLILAYSLSDKSFDIQKQMAMLATHMDSFIAHHPMREVARDFLHKRHCFYIGRGASYDLALEAALKLKEISYIQTEGFAAGELKHGTIALIEDDTPVIALISDPKKNNQTRSNLKEVDARGAKTLVITMSSMAKEGDIALGDIDPLIAPLLLVVPTQLLSYYAALERGYDIDKPRNLAKSVTVE